MKLSDECFTPADWVRVARDVLGSIDLDPASNADAQRVVRAERFYTIDDDGLAQHWSGRVWMNPPYSRPGPWVAKLLASYVAGDVIAAVALLNARTGSGWFRSLASHAWRCEKSQRIRFWGPGTTAGGTGRMDSCFFYLGLEPERFCAAFARFGHIVPPAAVTLGVTGALNCAVCSRPLNGMRSDSDTCSSRCRQRRYRLRKAVKPSTGAGVQLGERGLAGRRQVSKR